MTRENKLALVVGFGLILLVGILISDHFSAAQTQRPAELTHSVERLDRSRWSNPNLIAYRSGQATTTPAIETPAPAVELPPPPSPPPSLPSLPSPETSPAPAYVTEQIEDPMWAMPVPTGDAATTVEILGPADAAFYVVGPGESLISICREILGDSSLVTSVVALNDLPDPDKVAIGQRLRLPVISGAAPAAANPAETETPDEPGVYTVRDGDSLMTIAQRTCGTVRAFDEIFEANRDQLETPDELRPGMVLRIPTSDERPS